MISTQTRHLLLLAALALLCCLPSQSLLGVGAAECSGPPRAYPQLANLHGMCTHLRKVCVDQNIFVLYAEEDDPRSLKYKRRPRINFTNLHIDWHGFSDAWDTQLKYPDPIVRPATTGEETPELREPVFSKCTVPIVWYINYLYIFGEFYMRAATEMFIMQQKGWFDRNATLVVAALNMDLERYHHRWLQPYTRHDVTTLSHFSSRLPRHTRETYTEEGTHERCFENLYVCQVEWLNLWDYPRPFHSTAQHIMKYYEPRLQPPTEPELTDPSVLKVMFIDRPRTNTRNILNLRPLMAWCRGLEGSLLKAVPNSRYKRVHCVVHTMGRMLQDMALVRHFDVIVGLHGSGLFNAFFMARGGSIVEVRPTEFNGGWPNQYVRDMCLIDDKDTLLWWGINTVTRELCTPGLMEIMGKGTPSTWPRDRNVKIAIPALELVFRQILEVDRSHVAWRRKVRNLNP